jgi:heme exporter protein C
MQGIVQKILYVHVPCAFAAYLGFFFTGIFGAFYLAKNKRHYDHMAAASAEVGVLFCALVIVTGPIWAKATWGHWWSWDLRLTLTLLLFLIYVAYLLLRDFTGNNERSARFSAVYGIAGLFVIPINYFAIDLAGGRTMHPENLKGDSLGSGMMVPFFMGLATVLVVFLYLWGKKISLKALQARLAARGPE